MNIQHPTTERPVKPAGIPAGTGEVPRAAKVDAATVQAATRPASRTPPRVRKVDGGEVYRFWAFR